MTFGKKFLDETSNPLIHHFGTLQVNAVLTVQVAIQAPTSETHQLKFIIPISTINNNQPTEISSGNSSLNIVVNVNCNPMFCGPYCSTRCTLPTNKVSTDSTLNGCNTSECERKSSRLSSAVTSTTTTQYTSLENLFSTQSHICINVTCNNGGTCMSTGSSYACLCDSGYTGPSCQYKYCDSYLCLNGGQSVQGGSTCVCTCLAGFTGTHCQSSVDPCASRPCQNNGLCTVDESGDVHCSCPADFTGHVCEISLLPCVRNICSNGGSCLEGGGKQFCACRRGFIGKTCERTDHCKIHHCHNNGTCLNTNDGFRCICRPGFFGARCNQHNPCHNNGPCLNGGICSVSELHTAVCHCPADYTGQHCETDYTGCSHNISGCNKAECSDSSSPRCVRCVQGFALLQDKCIACLPSNPILHCEEEASSGCLFRWCSKCEEGFYKLGSECEVCHRPHIGCRHVTCSNPSDVVCLSCHPGFFRINNTCTECPRTIPNCEEYTCSGIDDVTCTRCRDGNIAYNRQCVPCPSLSVIPDCVDVGRDGCFKHWCNKCAPGFFIRGTVCDVCPSPDVGCQQVHCNSTSDSHCVSCYPGYELIDGKCKRVLDATPRSTARACSDHPSADCPSLQASLNICSDPSSACHYCPHYCNLCDLCMVPVIG